MQTTENKLFIDGPCGRLAATLYRPETDTDELCIVMHGFMGNQRYALMKQLRDMLLSKGYAVLLFDFDGHGKSEGRFRDMTVLKELGDAEAIWYQATQWQWVRKIYLIGHSQGGVVAGMLAGELGASKIAGVAQLAAAAVLHDDALEGHIMNAKFDPNNIPEYVRVFFIKKVGRDYFSVAQNLDIYQRSCSYTGPVCLVHGTDDAIVPFRYSERYKAEYPNAELHLLEGENHMFSRKTEEALQIVSDFMDARKTAK